MNQTTPEQAMVGLSNVIASGGVVNHVLCVGEACQNRIEWTDGCPTQGTDIEGTGIRQGEEVVAFIFTVRKSLLPPDWPPSEDDVKRLERLNRSVVFVSMAERQMQVAKILLKQTQPVGPQQIANEIGQDWCRDPKGLITSYQVKHVLDTMYGNGLVDRVPNPENTKRSIYSFSRGLSNDRKEELAGLRCGVDTGRPHAESNGVSVPVGHGRGRHNRSPKRKRK